MPPEPPFIFGEPDLDALATKHAGRGGPYGLDVTITLAAGGTVKIKGEGLDWRGIHEILALMASSIPADG